MTVDVEDYFQVQAFAGCVKREDWDSLPCHVEANTDRILAQFAETNTVATFFTLGWVAARYPALIRRIVEAGHELASHGHGHQLVHQLSPAGFREDLQRAKGTLEDVGGVTVRGYRAPTFSIGPQNLWAFDVLAETGHLYSSSVYPVRHDLYGAPNAPRFAHRVASGSLLEIPLTTLRLGQHNVPIAGGGYFRLMPYSVFKTALKRFNAGEKRAGVFYFHPWEIDAHQPRITGASRLAKFRHYVNIGAVPRRLDKLLRDFSWARMDDVFAADIAASR
ncbi:MAG: XrtA system polysaccharide deacetylase [Janthinobacterium lividum]